MLLNTEIMPNLLPFVFVGASSGSDADERSSPLLRKSPALGPQLVLPFIPPKFAADSSTLRPSEYLKSLQVKTLIPRYTV